MILETPVLGGHECDDSGISVLEQAKMESSMARPRRYRIPIVKSPHLKTQGLQNIAWLERDNRRMAASGVMPISMGSAIRCGGPRESPVAPVS